jgi:RNA polymerase sigma-70 factor (ECF subfamily)
VARRVLRDDYDAEDAVQESLIRGWRDFRSLRERSRFDAWMYRVLINCCRDQGRRRHRMRVEVPDLALERPDPTNHYARVVDADELERGFLELPLEHRAVLVLTHYLGMSARDAGQVLGIPTGTVYSRLHYGMRAMRAALSRAAQVPVAAAPEESR